MKHLNFVEMIALLLTFAAAPAWAESVELACPQTGGPSTLGGMFLYVDYAASRVTFTWGTPDHPGQLVGPFAAQISDQVIVWRATRERFTANRVTGQLIAELGTPVSYNYYSC